MQEFRRHRDTYGVQPVIHWPGITTPIAKEARLRGVTARRERRPQDVSGWLIRRGHTGAASALPAAVFITPQ